jgi:hypothetical protein
MDYGKIFAKAWDIIWEYKFLILLGVLVALSGAGSGGGNQSQYVFNQNDFQWEDLPSIEYGAPLTDLGLPILAIIGIIVLVGVIILLGLVFWVAGTIARGGLINGVKEIDEDNPTSFSEAFKAGWQKGWRLIGIGLVPAIPMLILAIISLSVFIGYGGFSVIAGGEFPTFGPGAFVPILVMACLLAPTAMILGLLRVFANRACMLEDLGVFGSYKRGFEVLGDNLGPALLLFLIQVALTIGIWVMMIVPGILMALCCLLWPLLILIEGAFTAYYSTLWTLAWNEWVAEELASSN